MNPTTVEELREIVAKLNAAENVSLPVLPGCKSATPTEARAYFDARFSEMSRSDTVTPELRAAIADKDAFETYLKMSDY